MESFISLAQILLLLSASALCIALIVYMGRITRKIEEMQADIKKISEQVSPLVDSLQLISRSVAELTDKLNKQVSEVEWIVSEVKDKIESVKTFTSALRTGIDDRVKSLVSTLGFVRDKMQHLFKKS
ncbi:MAG: hypothetical protein FMNOHCHN_01251 [Ignavibacteriaceae bacterium]|nr:hypothetical protein [Ignavibacteriaceae bacterium]MCK6615514.1 hypothetical protein [Ignavibacteriaceae bacterium]